MSIAAARRSHGVTRRRRWLAVEQFPFAVRASFDGRVGLNFLMWGAGAAFHAFKLRHGDIRWSALWGHEALCRVGETHVDTAIGALGGAPHGATKRCPG